MLPRTEFEMSETIRDFTVVYSGRQLARLRRAALLQPHDRRRSARWRCTKHGKTHGVGRRLVEALVAEARQFALDAVFAFTYVADFFRKVGFHEVERGELPLKAWKDCLRCPKFQACDEIAVLRVLRPDHWADAQPQLWGQAMIAPADELIQIPTPQKNQ